LVDGFLGFAMSRFLFSQDEEFTGSFDECIDVVYEGVKVLGFFPLLLFIGFNEFDHFGSVSHGNFQFAQILGQPDVLHFGVSLCILLHLSDGNDGVIFLHVSPVDQVHCGLDGLVKTPIIVLVLLNVVVNRLGSVLHSVSTERVLIQLNRDLVDHLLKLLHDRVIMGVFHQLVSVLQQLDEPLDFGNNSSLILVQPLELRNVLQEYHDFRMLGQNQLMRLIRSVNLRHRDLAQNSLVVLIHHHIGLVPEVVLLLGFRNGLVGGDFVSFIIHEYRVFIAVSRDDHVGAQVHVGRNSHGDGHLGLISHHFCIVGGDRVLNVIELQIIHPVPAQTRSGRVGLSRYWEG